MRIRSIRTYALRAELAEPFGWSVHTTATRQAVLVEVECDNGLIGWGESGSGTLPRVGAAFVDEVLAPLVIGEDPFDLAGIWQKVRGTFDRVGWHFGLSMQAFSGLEMALWDLMGRATGRPVWQLLGGRVRERVEAYATGLYYYPGQSDPSAAREAEARGYVNQGFRAMKMKVGGLTPADDAGEVERIRGAVGDDIRLMVDANGAYDSRTAIEIGRTLERMRIAWYEEPVQRTDVDGYLEVKRSLDLPITGGEHLATLDGFLPLISRRAVDIVQPDIANCGGLAEARRIAALASAFHVRVYPHVWGTPLAIAAALHFVATLPSTPATVTPTALAQEPLFEFDCTPHPIREALMTDALTPRSGWLDIPAAPGLGVDVDRRVLERFVAHD
jgi:D-galactarolactone cycloisomerase